MEAKRQWSNFLKILKTKKQKDLISQELLPRKKNVYRMKVNKKDERIFKKCQVMSTRQKTRPIQMTEVHRKQSLRS